MSEAPARATPERERPPAPRLLRFSPFELDLLSLELRRSGRPVRLQLQPAKVLALLARHGGRAVTRDEIQREVWGTNTFVDFEHGLNFCIRQIRATLGDDAAAPRFVETLPRVGYRFVAPVEAALEGALPDVAAPPAPRPRTLLLAAVFGLAILGLAVALASGRLGPKPAARVLLAVLPFENLSGDASQEYLADGLTEETITRLARVQPSRLGVIARTSAMRFKGTRRSVLEIGRELGVEFVLQGSLRREGARLRVAAQLVRVRDQTHQWAGAFEGGTGDALDLQKGVAERVAQAVVAPLLLDAAAPAPLAHTSSPEAYDAFLKGRYHLARGGAESLRSAVVFLEEAVGRDPRFAAAHAALAEAWVTLGDRGHEPTAKAYTAARAAAEAALALDPESAEAWVYLGVVKTYFDWDLASGPSAFEKAIALNPGLAIAHHYSADYLAATGRREEAIAATRRAQALDPLSRAVNEDVGWYFYFAGRYLEAAQQFRRTADLEPQSFLPHVYSAYAHAALQDWPQALAAAATAMRQSGTAPEDVDRLLSPGGRSAYLAFLRRALAWQRQQGGSCYCFSLLAELGDKEGALEDLRRARDGRWRYLLVEVGADPRLEPLRPDRRFQALERELGLRQ